jgi:hypothetical protein
VFLSNLGIYDLRDRPFDNEVTHGHTPLPPLAKPQRLICANVRTLYETLGIPKTAKPEQIKPAYRMLVKRFHPDLFPIGSAGQSEAEVRIRQINAAYGVLSNPEKRSAYDAKIIKQRSPYGESRPEYCNKCGKPSLYWQIDREVPLCNDRGRSALSRY